MRSDDTTMPGAGDAEEPPVNRLQRIVLIVAMLNFAYFFVEFAVALAAGSVSLLADSVDFLEDTAINLLIFIALGWPLARRAVMGKAMTLVLLGPAAVAGWKALEEFSDPTAPAVLPLVLASIGAIGINGTCARLLAGVRHHGGSLSRAAFLSARNDVLVNVSIIVMGIVTIWTDSGWPDLILGCLIILLALHAAYEVWEVSEEERLPPRPLRARRSADHSGPTHGALAAKRHNRPHQQRRAPRRMPTPARHPTPARAC